MAKTLITPTQQNRAASKFDVDASKFTYHPPENIPENEQTTDSEGNRASIRAGYYTDPSGKIVNRIDETYTTGDQDYGQQLETHAGPSTYQIPVKVGNQEFTGTFEENGNFRVGYGKEFYKNGHHWLPTLDAQGNVSYINNDTRDGFGDFVRMVAMSALTAGLGGAAGVGNSLFGLSGTAGTVAGGAALGAGKAALTGGDILRGALTGGLGGAGGIDIGDTGFSVGDAMTAAKMAQAAQKGDFMGALAGAASLTGGSDFKIGDFTVGELLKDAKLAQSMFGGKQGPGAIKALTNFANTKQNDVVNTLKDAGLTQADASPITPAAKTAAPTTPMPAAQPTGIDPVALLQAQMSGDNGGAQIKSDYSLFGKELFGPDKASASSTQARNAPQSDALMAALGDGGYDEQEFSGGGDVHALLQLLRS